LDEPHRGHDIEDVHPARDTTPVTKRRVTKRTIIFLFMISILANRRFHGLADTGKYFATLSVHIIHEIINFFIEI
jgi:hypothetical protein